MRAAFRFQAARTAHTRPQTPGYPDFVRTPFGPFQKPLAGALCAGLLLPSQAASAFAQHFAAPRGVPLRVAPSAPVGPLGPFLPATAHALAPTALPAPVLTPPRLMAPAVSAPHSPVSRVAAALVARRDAPGLVGVIGHRLAGPQENTPAAASFITPTPEVQASAGASKDWSQASFDALLGDRARSGRGGAPVEGRVTLRRNLLSVPSSSVSAVREPSAPQSAPKGGGIRTTIQGMLVSFGVVGLLGYFEVINPGFGALILLLGIQVAYGAGVGFLARRKAVRVKAEQQARQEAAKREFVDRLRGSQRPAASDPKAAGAVSDASRPARVAGMVRFFDSWPGALLATGAGVAVAVLSGLVTVEFLPQLVMYAGLTAASLALPALGRDWLAARLAGAAQRGSGLDWSLKGLLSRVSPLMTLALPIVAFSFTGVLFGRAKGAVDSDASSSRRAAAALAGPVVNAGLALLGAAVAAGLAWVGAPEVFVTPVSTFIVVNIMTAFIDLLPLFPSGGHHALRHVLGHTLALPGAAAWLDRHRGLQLVLMAGALFLGGGLLNEFVLTTFGFLFWPATLASAPS